MEEENSKVKEYMKREYRYGFVSGLLTAISIALAINCGIIIKNVYIDKSFKGKKKLEYIQELMDKVYIDDITQDQYYEGMITGMVSVPTDRYSYYMDKEAAEDFSKDTKGNYVGIGILVRADLNKEQIEIQSVFENSPAEEAGLKDGDIVTAVDDVVSDFYNYQDIVDAVSGEEGSTVHIKVYRPVEERNIEFDVTRRAVDVPTAAYTILENNIGYIRISAFDGVTAKQFKDCYDALRKENIDGLIIDIRGNLGGLLDSVSSIADELIPEGIITYTEDKNGEREYVYAKGDGIDIPLAVLINENSASASELLAGCVKDTNSGKLVGKTTFGKGIVQTTYNMKDGSAVKLTTAKYYTPSGVCIHEKGVEPDYEVEADENFELPVISGEHIKIDTENDAQLKKAIEVVNDMNK